MIRAFAKMVADRLNRAEVYSQASYWNGKAAALEGKAASMWRNNALNERYHREMLRLLDEELPSLAGVELLEVGSGTGRLSTHFAAAGARVTGIDFADKAVAIARAAVRDGNPEYRVESVFDLAEESRYDVVVTWGSLVFACRDRSQVRRALERMRIALRPGGLMVLMEPMHTGVLSRVLRMSPREFIRCARDAGLECDGVRHLHFWPVRLLLAYVEWPGWLTRGIHDAGEGFMKTVLRRSMGGDYQVYRLRRPG